MMMMILDKSTGIICKKYLTNFRVSMIKSLDAQIFRLKMVNATNLITGILGDKKNISLVSLQI